MSVKFKRPGLDLNDAETLSGAKRVATRKNNNFKRMVEKKLPLFADEMFADYETVTPEKVIEDRKIHHADWNERKKDMRQFDRDWIRRSREEIQTLLANENEFIFIVRLVGRMQGGSRAMKWSRALTLVKARLNKALSENADLVLAWISQEEKPVTQYDIWEKRGDGLEPETILHALMELGQVAYADTVDLVELPERFIEMDKFNRKTVWTWEAVKQG